MFRRCLLRLNFAPPGSDEYALPGKMIDMNEKRREFDKQLHRTKEVLQGSKEDRRAARGEVDEKRSIAFKQKKQDKNSEKVEEELKLRAINKLKQERYLALNEEMKATLINANSGTSSEVERLTIKKEKVLRVQPDSRAAKRFRGTENRHHHRDDDDLI